MRGAQPVRGAQPPGAGEPRPGSLERPLRSDARIHCGLRTRRVPLLWWVPEGQARSLVVVQHGFARRGDRMADLCDHLARAGHLVVAPSLPSAGVLGFTVGNLGNNTPCLRALAMLFGCSGERVELERSWREATGRGVATRLGDAAGGGPFSVRGDRALPQRLVLVGHSAGAEAVAHIGGTIRTRHDASRLAGVILLDPVPSRTGSNLAVGLANLGPVPVRVIAAKPGPCNAQGVGVDAVRASRSGFVGVRLLTGSHADAEGASTTRPAVRVCGAPDPRNVAALQRLTCAWVGAALAGLESGPCFPGGEVLEDLVATGVARVL